MFIPTIKKSIQTLKIERTYKMLRIESNEL